ncbi:unnamed protein product [Discosporangium mesarthrocarpum]
MVNLISWRAFFQHLFWLAQLVSFVTSFTHSLSRSGRLPGCGLRTVNKSRSLPTCGLQVLVRIKGKRSREDDYTNEAYEEYAKRLRPVLSLETHWHKTDEDLETAARKDSGVVVCLDENGSLMDSPTFSRFLFSKLEEGGSRLTFVVGGADGLPPGLKQNPPRSGNMGGGGMTLSLSPMTFTHLWARSILAEQIYRATEIRKGSGYHKEGIPGPDTTPVRRRGGRRRG